MKKDWYLNQDTKRAAFLENLVTDMDKACGIRHVFAGTRADSIASARTWPKARSQRQTHALYKSRAQPAGGQGATLNVVAALAR